MLKSGGVFKSNHNTREKKKKERNNIFWGVGCSFLFCFCLFCSFFCSFFLFFFFSETLISALHLSAHLPSGNSVSSPFPNSSLMEKLGRKRSLKTFLGIEATRACCCTITQADPFENNF